MLQLVRSLVDSFVRAEQETVLDTLLNVFTVLFIGAVLISAVAAGFWTPIHDIHVHYAHLPPVMTP